MLRLAYKGAAMVAYSLAAIALLPVLLGAVALQAWRVIELHGFYGGDAGLRDKARWSVRA